jgi:hypothetical protein
MPRLNANSSTAKDVSTTMIYTHVLNRGGRGILSPKALADFIDNEPVVLSPEHVKLIAFHLSRYVRAEAAAQEA